MLSLDDIHADIEADRSSREGEIRLIERLMKASEDSQQRSMLRRSLVVLAYAHLEGFTKFSLFAYASSINATKIRCCEASIPIAAASLSKVFAALRNPASKHEFFRRTMPDDSKLHLVAREHAFVADYDKLTQHTVNIPDELIDTKSNLSPDILKKLLFQLGLDFKQVNEHQGVMGKLLGVRNHIAHGDRFKVPTELEVEEYITSAFDVMGFLQREIYAALQAQHYRRKETADGDGVAVA